MKYRSQLHATLAQQNADAVRDCAFDGADRGHLQTGGPPTADSNQRLGCADGEVSNLSLERETIVGWDPEWMRLV